MLRPYGLYKEHLGAKTQRYLLFKLCFLVLSQHLPTKIMGLPQVFGLHPHVSVGLQTKHTRIVWT